ncbi:SDR family NAD(P)-dependent oxidoreductase [Streptomyces brasiliensis]|uniref:Probable oxidoreductase n=1 Tax=Streptomyces brasiliensis TaxID=1954 RepID=A0A917L289_9ACTN|nr:SDR family NAD(P)-dependent oxidoreductase [Streptomyces brasiliensis]GGJ41311.1 oxidoreductase [Streptomyces brasiliensis]
MGERLQGFGFASTVDEVVEGVDLTGRTAIVTGATSGIGAETARALALTGARVVLAARRTGAAAEIAARLSRQTGNDRIEARELDLADPRSVRRFSDDWTGPAHILVNNAGIMALPELVRTPYGWEQQLATNFFGHFALVQGLERPLAEASGSRVVCLSSAAHLRSPVVFDDLHFKYRPYDPWQAYAQSKTADVLLAVEITHRWSDRGVRANGVHPGIIHTELQRHIQWDAAGLPLKSVAQGAATSVLLATAPELEGLGGAYYQDCRPARVVEERSPGYSGGVAPYALDPANAERLWDTAVAALASGSDGFVRRQA